MSYNWRFTAIINGYGLLYVRSGPLYSGSLSSGQPRLLGFLIFSLFLGFVSVFSAIRYGPFISTKGLSIVPRVLPLRLGSNSSSQHQSSRFCLNYTVFFFLFFFLLYNCVAVCALYKKIKERKENWVHHQITTTRRCVYTTRRQSKRLENGNKFQNSTIAADRLTFF